MAPPISSKFGKAAKNDPQDSFREEVWDTLGKSVASRSPQDLKNKQIHSKVRQKQAKVIVRSFFDILFLAIWDAVGAK